MHSPPPTPDSRLHGRATRTIDRISQTKESISHSEVLGRKRKRDQAGLITPKDTPSKTAERKDGRLLDNQTATVLFPFAKHNKKFKIFQDPRSPDPFEDDEKNPFKEPKLPSRRTRLTEPVSQCSDDDSSNTTAPEVRDTSDHEFSDTDTSDSKRKSKRKRSTSPRRQDGMTYLFRGQQVFRKYKSQEEAEAAESVKPKRLFVKEMAAPKLSNPFMEDESDSDSESGFDGIEDLEISSSHDLLCSRPKSIMKRADDEAPSKY